MTGRGISEFKGPEMIICLACSRDQLANLCDIKLKRDYLIDESREVAGVR